MAQSKRIQSTLVAILCLGLAACGSGGSGGSSAPPPSPSNPGPLLNTGKMHALVNAERSARGLPTLARSRKLDEASRVHGRDMAARNYFAHRSPDGSTMSKRVAATGYGACFAAENIGYGSLYSSAEAMMDGWMASAGHRRNILSAKATELGFAKIGDPDGSHDPLWVMVLGRPGC